MHWKVIEAPAAASLHWRTNAESRAGTADRLTERLQAAYDDVLNEPVPSRLLRLFTQFDRKETDP